MFGIRGIGLIAAGLVCFPAPLLLRKPRRQTVHLRPPTDTSSTTPTVTLPTVQVVGVTPLPGSGIDIDKVPANVQTLSAGQLWPDGQNDLVPTAVARRLSQVNLNNEQGSQFQPDFVYRGFEASPISGIPQGIAVYQNGVRINEAFGDTVNWDLIPQFAVNRLTLQGNNPVFGLNALGGAVALEMKNGFNFHGFDGQLAGGSFGNINGFAQEGARWGNFGLYAAFGGTHDDGFRFHSPTNLAQGYVDLGWESNPFTVHLSVAASDSVIGATGPTPVELLAQDIRNTFTIPQSIHNEAELVQLTGTYQPTDLCCCSPATFTIGISPSICTDGNLTDVTPCTNNGDFFCLEGNDLFPDDVLFDSKGNQVPTSVLPPGATPGEIDITSTSTNTVGAGLQAKFTNPLLDRENSLAVGLTGDHSVTSLFGSRRARHAAAEPQCPRLGRDHRSGPQPDCIAADRSAGGCHRHQQLFRRVCHRHLQHHAQPCCDAERSVQSRSDRADGSDRYLSRHQRQQPFHPLQPGRRADLQDHRQCYGLCRMVGRQPCADAGRAGLLEPGCALHSRRVPGVRTAFEASRVTHIRGRLPRQLHHGDRSRANSCGMSAFFVPTPSTIFCCWRLRSTASGFSPMSERRDGKASRPG